MKPLVVIPARSGSKGVPNKNKKLLHGKPLIQYTIEAALEVFDAHKICISTDDKDIIELADKLGVKPPFFRPEELSNDTASSQDVLLHAVEFYENVGFDMDTVILLQPTSPFRSGKQLKEAIEIYSEELDMVVSVKASKASPYFNLFEENDQGFLQKSKEGHFTRRQDAPDIYEYNGAIYIINKESLKSTSIGSFERVKKYIMDEKSSHDIDTPFDWNIAELLISL